MNATRDEGPSSLIGEVVAGTGAAIAGTVVGAYLGPNAGALASAALTPIFERVARLDQRSWQNVDSVLGLTLEATSLDADALASWSDGSQERLRLVGQVVEAAMHSRDDARIPGLARVLSEANQDDAKLDTAPLIVRALRELEPPHVRVLATMTDTPTVTLDKHALTWSLEHLKLNHPQFAIGMEPIVATLDRIGAIYGSAGFGGPIIWDITDFGRLCLEYLSSEAGDIHTGDNEQ